MAVLVFYIFVLTLITKTSTAITSNTYANEDCSGKPATIAQMKVSYNLIRFQLQLKSHACHFSSFFSPNIA
jgi:hypothetical protein